MEREEITMDFYFRELAPRPIRDQLLLLNLNIKNITKTDIVDFKATTDREVIDCIQEAYSFIYCLVHKLEYETFDVGDYLEKDRYFQWIANYKMEHFADEIFQELGFELVEKIDEGYIVRDAAPKGKMI